MMPFTMVLLFNFLVLFVNTHVLSINPSNSDDLSENRIIGGEPAHFGQFPFQAGLYIKLTDYSNFIKCGGSLISRNYVLTAAHCVPKNYTEYINVYLGALELEKEDEDHLLITVPPANLIIHEDYNPDNLANDIALLRLPVEVKLTDKIRTIALPNYSNAKLSFEGKTVIASGWGRYSDALDQSSAMLRFVQLSVIGQVICRHFYKVLPSNICTDTGLGQGTCYGDSGGPLIYTNETGSTFIVGMTSFGSKFNCVESGWPTVSTRITSYLDWIAAKSGIEIDQ